MKVYVLQYIQMLRSNPSAELNLNPYLLSISAKIQQCNIHIVRESSDRESKIKSLKQEIHSLKQEYFNKCSKLISSYTSLQSKLQQVDEELLLSQNLSNPYTEKISLKDLILYSFRISGTTSAPFNWNYLENLPSAFHPPFPQELEIRATKLFEAENLERTSKPQIIINKLQNHNHISIISVPGSFVRYTIDSSLPSDMTGLIYQQPFIVPIDSDFIIKAVAFMEGKKESEVVVMSVQNASLAMPGRLEHVAERPAHVVTSRAPLDLGLFSPNASSRHSSDEDEFTSPFLTFGR